MSEMSSQPYRKKWGELEQLCTFPVLMKFWQQSAAYVTPEERTDAPLFLKRDKRSSAETKAAVDWVANNAGALDSWASVSQTLSSAPKPVGDNSDAPPGPHSSKYSHYPSRLVTPEGKVTRTGADRRNYTVISYTWGRWKDASSVNDSELEGCNWKVPANTLFTRKQLDTAICKIADGQHVWLDVFCIPQDDGDAEKAIEIGKQGNIFTHATYAVVWLCSGGEETLQDICSWIHDDFEHPALDLGPTNSGLRQEVRRRLSVLSSLRIIVPWTSSLWTLQESALRKDAIFHDQEGNQVLNPRSKALLSVGDLIKAISQISTELESALDISQWMSEEDFALFTDAIFEISAVGLARLDSMNANELYLASNHRMCERVHDRVYGIMGALDVSMPVDYSLDVDQLKNKFIVSLHNKYPAEMQSFIQVLQQPIGTSWKSGARVTSLSEFHQDLNDHSNNISFIEVKSSGALVAGAAITVSPEGLQDICLKLEHGNGALGIDDLNLEYVEPSNAWPQQERTWRKDQQMSCQNLRFLATYFQFVLVPLGRVSETAHMCPVFVYLLTRASLKDFKAVSEVKVQRTGILILSERHDTDMVVDGLYSIH
jgi:hypothetical protein